jgi:hypothetical protein
MRLQHVWTSIYSCLSWFMPTRTGLELRVKPSNRSSKWWLDTRQGEESIKIGAEGPIPVGKEMTLLILVDLSSQYEITSKWKWWWGRNVHGLDLQPQDFVLAYTARGATVLPHPSGYAEENGRITEYVLRTAAHRVVLALVQSGSPLNKWERNWTWV